MNEEIIFTLIVVLIAICLIIEIYKSVKEEKIKEEEIKKEDDWYSTENVWKRAMLEYPIGKWDEEVRKDIKPIVSIENKYKCNLDLTVLVGDYNKQSISNTVCVLESLGIKTVIAKSGVEIINRIKNGENYDAIVSNNIYDRGHCDGPETLKILRNIKDFNIPVIVLTVSEGERKLFTEDYGFDEYMTKCLTQKEAIDTFSKIFQDIKFKK